MSVKLIPISQNDSTAAALQKMTRNLEALLREVNSMREEIKQLKGHTVSMPDTDNVCSDHDKRYYTRSEIDAMLL